MTHGQEDALVHWCESRTACKAQPLHIVGYGDEEEADGSEGGEAGAT